MNLYRAVATVDGFGGYEDASEDDTFAAWQFLIDTGACWQLEGRFGRAARDLIAAGLCHLPAGFAKQAESFVRCEAGSVVGSVAFSLVASAGSIVAFAWVTGYAQPW